jgi:hypothetical protein
MRSDSAASLYKVEIQSQLSGSLLFSRCCSKN